VLIRPATTADIPAITEILDASYDTTAEWTEERHTVEERTRWLAAHDVVGHPVLVADDDGDVVGWAAYGDFRDSVRWPGYRFVVEHTVHVAARAKGRGVGRALMAALADRARASGKRVLVGAIDGANVASLTFHERIGFREVGRLPGIGEKWGQRLDLVLVQLDLDAPLS
jgi:L-amino acid N-acyltransferase